jgi:hypothetical protein
MGFVQRIGFTPIDLIYRPIVYKADGFSPVIGFVLIGAVLIGFRRI